MPHCPVQSLTQTVLTGSSSVHSACTYWATFCAPDPGGTAVSRGSDASGSLPSGQAKASSKQMDIPYLVVIREMKEKKTCNRLGSGGDSGEGWCFR